MNSSRTDRGCRRTHHTPCRCSGSAGSPPCSTSGVMPSKARKALDENAGDIDRLLEIHTKLGGSGVGRRHQLEVLNKSALVLLTANWEAYCEDIAAEALEHLIQHSKAPEDLPKGIRQLV